MVNIEYINSPNEDHCEGVIWLPKTNEVVWVNVFEKPKIIIYNLITHQVSSIPVSSSITSVAPMHDNNFIATIKDGFYLITRTGKMSLKAKAFHFETEELLNDGRCDSKGRYFCASMDKKMKRPIGKLYQLDLDGEVKVLDENLIVGNGIAFSPDETTFYLSDSRKEAIYKYDYDIVSGKISNRRLFFSTDKIVGRPDGAAVDNLGNYWSALFEGKSLIQIDNKSGKLISKIDLPVSYPTMCCFGGQKLDKLYVSTSKRMLLDDEIINEPLAGKTLILNNLGIKGSQATMLYNT